MHLMPIFVLFYFILFYFIFYFFLFFSFISSLHIVRLTYVHHIDPIIVILLLILALNIEIDIDIHILIGHHYHHHQFPHPTSPPILISCLKFTRQNLSSKSPSPKNKKNFPESTYKVKYPKKIPPFQHLSFTKQQPVPSR
jgi:hypothetical protein